MQITAYEVIEEPMALQTAERTRQWMNDTVDRFAYRCKREAVLRLLRGEDLESVSRELGITAARLSQWRDQFLAGGEANLKARESDPQVEENQRLQAKVGELLMETELLYAKENALEGGRPLTRRRSRR